MPTTTADLSRAIYIDFEGHQDQAPALIGILVDDAFEIVVLDWRRTHPEVRPARRARRVRRVRRNAGDTARSSSRRASVWSAQAISFRAMYPA